MTEETVPTPFQDEFDRRLSSCPDQYIALPEVRTNFGSEYVPYWYIGCPVIRETPLGPKRDAFAVDALRGHSVFTFRTEREATAFASLLNTGLTRILSVPLFTDTFPILEVD